MQIEGAVALVTGANRGLGRAFAQQLLERGAAKVYASARQPDAVDIPGVEPLGLDITNSEQVMRAAQVAGDVTLLVNNAGTTTRQNLMDGDVELIRLDMETHFFGTLAMMRAFAPVLARNGGGAMISVLSAMSWYAFSSGNAYHAAKAAGWALANSARVELAGQGTLVTAVHLGVADTDMTAPFDVEKLPPRVVVDAALDGVEANQTEVLVDDWTRAVKARLSEPPPVTPPSL